MVRHKNRYFTVEITSQDMHPSSMEPLHLNTADICHAVLNVTERIHGEFGAASIKNGLSVKYVNPYTRVSVIRTRHGPHRLLGSSLPFLTHINNRAVRVHGIYTGATVVKCLKFLKKYHQQKLIEVLQQCKTAAEREKMIENLKKVEFES